MARIELEAVSKRYGDVHAVHDFSLAIDEGELVVLLGPSGCGKTTTLRMIAGFVPVTSGRIRLGGREVTNLPAHRRNTGLVCQGYALFPHLTAAQDEALAMADRLVVMSAGAIQQIGTQRELYEHPRNRFVAGFVGRTNFLRGQLIEPGVFRSDGGLTLRYDGRSAPSSAGAPGASPSGVRRALALRPERLALGVPADAARANRVAGTVEFASYLGSIIEYYVRLSSGETLRVHAPNTGAAGDRAWALGETVHVSWPVEVGLVLEAEHHPEEDHR